MPSRSWVSFSVPMDLGLLSVSILEKAAPNTMGYRFPAAVLNQRGGRWGEDFLAEMKRQIRSKASVTGDSTGRLHPNSVIFATDRLGKIVVVGFYRRSVMDCKITGIPLDMIKRRESNIFRATERTEKAVAEGIHHVTRRAYGRAHSISVFT